MWVELFNQLELPIPPPLLDPSFSDERFLSRRVLLKPDDMLAAIAFAEAFEGAVPVLLCSSDNVICMTCIERSVSLVCCDISAEAGRGH